MEKQRHESDVQPPGEDPTPVPAEPDALTEDDLDKVSGGAAPRPPSGPVPIPYPNVTG